MILSRNTRETIYFFVFASGAARGGVIIEKKRLSEWTSLEPGVTIPDASNFSSITIEINGVRVH